MNLDNNYKRNNAICSVYALLSIAFTLLFFRGVEVDPIGTMFHGAFMKSRESFMTTVLGRFSEGVFPNLTVSHDHSIGYFLYYGKLGALLNVREGYRIMAIVQMFFICVCLAILPFEIYKIREKIADVVLSYPLIACIYGSFFFIFKTDVHWASIWCMTLSIPLLIMLVKDNNLRKSIILTSLVVVFISVSNIVRAHSGLYSLAGLLTVMVIRIVRSWGKETRNRELLLLCGTCVGIAITYNLFVNVIPNAICVLHGQDPSVALHTFWHNFYIGFGTYKNPYGLVYKDECAVEIVKSLYPNVTYGEREYYEICKQLAMEMIKKDPVFCLVTLARKFADSIRIVLCYYFFRLSARTVLDWGIILTYIYMLKKKKIVFDRTIGLIMLMILLTSFAQAVMASPTYVFLLWPTFGVVGISILIMAIQLFTYCYETIKQRKATV